MDELFQLISNLGFPIALSIYLLVRLESKMKELTESIHELTLAIRGGE